MGSGGLKRENRVKLWCHKFWLYAKSAWEKLKQNKAKSWQKLCQHIKNKEETKTGSFEAFDMCIFNANTYIFEKNIQ